MSKFDQLGEQQYQPFCVNFSERSEVQFQLSKRDTCITHYRIIYIDQAKQSGKPDEIVEKMVEGRLKKFFQENVLLEQNFVKDPSKTITDLITDKVSVLGENIVVNSFSRFQIGEK